jgi:hypothetical protein
MQACRKDTMELRCASDGRAAPGPDCLDLHSILVSAGPHQGAVVTFQGTVWETGNPTEAKFLLLRDYTDGRRAIANDASQGA